MARLGLSSPWVLYYKEVSALFENDKEVRVLFDEESCVLKIYVEKSAKAGALMQLLPDEKSFGNVTLKIEVIPANDLKFLLGRQTKDADVDLICTALEGNKAVSAVKTVRLLYNNVLTYIVFENKVVQYFTDDLGDYFGLRSTLYEDLAREVFGKKDGVFFCTDRGTETEAFGEPLGEWP